MNAGEQEMARKIMEAIREVKPEGGKVEIEFGPGNTWMNVYGSITRSPSVGGRTQRSYQFRRTIELFL